MKSFQKRNICPKLEILEPGEHLAYPVRQHIGKDAEIVVNIGDRVLEGQILAKGGTLSVSANVHASVSGIVSDIKPVITMGGQPVRAVIIKNDGRYEVFSQSEKNKKKRIFDKMSPDEIINAVYNAGIVGMGGAGFPTHIKLSKDRESIRYIIINGAECEPYISADHRLMLCESDRLICGIQILLKLFCNASAVVVIEDDKMDAVKLLAEKTKSNNNIDIKVIKSGYPKGAERQLVNAVTKKRLAMGKLPSEAGCIVCNVATVTGICKAVVEAEPFIKRIVTVTGDAVPESHNYLVRIGTDIGTVIQAARVKKEQVAKIIIGGPMMGKAVYSYDIPVTKTTSAIICMTEKEAFMAPESVCIRCGKCVDVCPERLVPQILAEYAERYEWDLFRRAGGMNCCECGSCTYVCPASRSLTQIFAGAKNVVKSREA